ncbi:putative UBX domain protein [Penicillium brasilianum]|uniref:Putative UBX domain protein n=1 Tax=Penicillium brasilianum TaxID=104259 RepID=A0A1S9R9V0_PENBI|nr:putative UBX domain protein [Penicillium brasilianum]
MSAHVVVIDATARRATVKTTPGKYLTDILQEACLKLGYNASQYGLKHNRKQLDLSLSFRLSGLSSGAKLELVQLSRSPSIVTVALQLPESEARGAPNGRITDKFPSTTTLWLVLRKFEAGVAGSGPARNLTARGVPSISGDSGAGRLFYEIPVLQIMDRELSSFTDLQKSLAQLGFNSGNVLIRLSFRRTEKPLEEAMTNIAEYFKSPEDELPGAQPGHISATPPAEGTVGEPQDQAAIPSTSEIVDEPVVQGATAQELPSSVSDQPAALTAGRAITVFSPPTNDTPSSAQLSYNEEDYIPSVEHAKAHQRLLNEASRNKRLLTDAEIAAKAAAEEARRSEVREVDVKVRFPDQSQVIAKFGPRDSGSTLYGFVRNCLAPPFAAEKFTLNVFSSPTAVRSAHANTIPDSDQSLLIKDLGLAGRVLVNFSWTDTSAAGQRRTNLLRPELRSQAQELKVEQPPEPVEEPSASTLAKAEPSGAHDGGKPGGTRKPGAMPKWLKLPGKK